MGTVVKENIVPVLNDDPSVLVSLWYQMFQARTAIAKVWQGLPSHFNVLMVEADKLDIKRR